MRSRYHRLWVYVERWTGWLWGGLDRIVNYKGGSKKIFNLYSKNTTDRWNKLKDVAIGFRLRREPIALFFRLPYARS